MSSSMSRLRSITARVLREQSGMGMFEVLMSALILAVISMGVLKTFDTAGATSGFNKSRATSANLATEDLERLRGFRAAQLTGLDQTRTRPVNGINYTVRSTATWLSDDSGSRTCTSDGKQIEYVKLTSKVTWPTMKTDAQAVSQSTLYAPPKGSFGTQGAMAVQVLDRNGNGLTGVSVTATGPASLSGTTDSIGCVYFPYIATGAYTASVSKAGYLDPTGLSTPTATVGVVAENVTTQSFDLDQPGTIEGTVKTYRADAAGGAATIVPSGTVTLSHSQLDIPRTAPVSSSPGPSLGTYSFANAFPFTGTYYASPGNCDGTTTAGGLQVAVAPLSSNTGKDLVQPSVKLVVNTSPGFAATEVKIELSPTSSTSGCADKTYYGKATASGAANTSWWLSTSSATDVPGTTYQTTDSTVPYGSYDACISAKVPAAGNAIFYWKATNIALTDQTKVDTIPIRTDAYSASNRTGYGTSAAQVGC